MRARIARGCLTAAAILLLAPVTGAAQTVPSPFRFIETKQEVGLLFGVTDAARGRFGFGPGGGLRLGARWGIRISGPLGFEGVAGLITGQRDVVDPRRPDGDRKIGEVDALLGTVDGRLRFTFTGERSWHGLAPFIVAGGGLIFDASAAQALDEELDTQDRFDFGTGFLGTFGGGTHVYLTDRLALRGDGIFSLWKINTPPGFSDPDRGIESVEESEWVSALHLTVSAVIRF
jgi:hypothetical protein